MKFHKDEGTPQQNIGIVTIFENVPFKVIRLSDGFVQYRQNKPKKGSELWDKTKYKIMEWEFCRETKSFFYKNYVY